MSRKEFKDSNGEMIPLFDHRQVVADADGNRYLFIQPLGNGMVLLESLSTRERFSVPVWKVER